MNQSVFQGKELIALHAASVFFFFEEIGRGCPLPNALRDNVEMFTA
jgi:hypothetical protein